MTSPKRPLERLAFTLIELLVVIAIISILIALLVPAVMRFMGKKEQMNAANEIGQLDTAIQTFKLEYKVAYVPSRFLLCEQLSDYGAAPVGLAKDSLNYLLSMFPRLGDNPGVIDWNGDGSKTGPVTLEGDQCLVFFLGGVPVGTSGVPFGVRNGPPGCFGFSTDPRDPLKMAQVKGRKGPWYDFKAPRLKDRTGKGYYSYADPYATSESAQPYVYFSSYDDAVGYNKFGASDCASLGVAPYIVSTTPPRFYNPKGYQIICAGVDRLFGPGGVWPDASGGIDPRGRDDHSNFNDGRLMGVRD